MLTLLPRSSSGRLWNSLPPFLKQRRFLLTFSFLTLFLTLTIWSHAKLVASAKLHRLQAEAKAKSTTQTPTSTPTPTSYTASPTAIPDSFNQPIAHPYVSDWPSSPAAQFAEWYASYPKGSTLLSPFWRPQTRIAVIIASSPTTQLLPLILHFSTLLGPTWPILLMTSNETITHYQSRRFEEAFERKVAAGAVGIVSVPSAVKLDRAGERDFLLTRTWFWETLGEVEHVLIFGNDTMLCANSDTQSSNTTRTSKVEDFFEWDFVGAPTRRGGLVSVAREADMLGNLSLRNATLARKIVNEYDAVGWWDDARIVGGDRHEEEWFLDMIKRKNGTVASRQVAEKWAGSRGSLGVVELGNVDEVTRRELDEWCPDWRLAAGGEKEGVHRSSYNTTHRNNG